MAHDEAVLASHPDELEPDEPRTPLWMPLLGVVLFLTAAIFWIATRPAGKTADELSKAAAAKVQQEEPPAPAPEQAAPTPTPAPMPGRMPAGRPTGGRPTGG
ncbi:MAG: hypothetical protein KC776_22715 [Myxococcales bacterium]|nr:hypothetical protein [Myxococcales bacterium]MCB9581470.1 hypothetical protein [Polyangiaceae bacterium]